MGERQKRGTKRKQRGRQIEKKKKADRRAQMEGRKRTEQQAFKNSSETYRDGERLKRERRDRK